MSYGIFKGKTQEQLSAEWKEWQKTTEGINVKKFTSLKSIDLSSPFAKIIIEYWNCVKTNLPNAKFLFPADKAIYCKYMVNLEEHLEGQSLLLIVKSLDPDLWMHLFRELEGGYIAKKHGRTIESVYAVKDALDLEKEETAWNYIKRSVPKKMDGK